MCVVVKIPGEDNPADFMTKFLNVEVIEKRLDAMRIEKNNKDTENPEKKKLVAGRLSRPQCKSTAAEGGVEISPIPTFVGPSG